MFPKCRPFKTFYHHIVKLYLLWENVINTLWKHIGQDGLPLFFYEHFQKPKIIGTEKVDFWNQNI